VVVVGVVVVGVVVVGVVVVGVVVVGVVVVVVGGAPIVNEYGLIQTCALHVYSSGQSIGDGLG